MGEEKKGFWSRLVSGLSKTRDNIVSGIDSIFSGFSSIDDDFYEEIEEILIMGDICLLYTSDAADEEDSVDLGVRPTIKKKKKKRRRTT